MPSHRAWKRLERADRAVCRFLLANGVSNIVIHTKLGWSTSTIYKIEKDHYVTKDVKAEDEQYLEECKAILRMIRQEGDVIDSGYSAKENTTAPRCTKRVTVRAQALCPPPPPSSRRRKRASTSALDPFLKTLLSSVSMDKKWSASFGKAQVTKKILQRFAKLPSVHLHDFLAEMFPTMQSDECFKFEEALNKCLGHL